MLLLLELYYAGGREFVCLMFVKIMLVYVNVQYKMISRDEILISDAPKVACVAMMIKYLISKFCIKTYQYFIINKFPRFVISLKKNI